MNRKVSLSAVFSLTLLGTMSAGMADAANPVLLTGGVKTSVHKNSPVLKPMTGARYDNPTARPVVSTRPALRGAIASIGPTAVAVPSIPAGRVPSVPTAGPGAKSGSWGVPSGSWNVKSGSWGAPSGSWNVKSGSWGAPSGSWNVKSGSWNAQSGGWGVQSGSYNAPSGSWGVQSGSWHVTQK